MSSSCYVQNHVLMLGLLGSAESYTVSGCEIPCSQRHNLSPWHFHPATDKCASNVGQTMLLLDRICAGRIRGPALHSIISTITTPFLQICNYSASAGRAHTVVPTALHCICTSNSLRARRRPPTSATMQPYGYCCAENNCFISLRLPNMHLLASTTPMPIHPSDERRSSHPTSKSK